MSRLLLLVAAVIGLSGAVTAHGVDGYPKEYWRSKDGRLSISGTLLAQPEADPKNRLKLIAVGELAEFKHSGAASEVKGEARIILYYPEILRLELRGSVQLEEDANTYSAEHVIYDMKSQTIVRPQREKYFIKPSGWNLTTAPRAPLRGSDRACSAASCADR